MANVIEAVLTVKDDGSIVFKKLSKEASKTGKKMHDAGKHAATGWEKARGALGSLQRHLFSLKTAIVGVGAGLLARSFLQASNAAEQYGVRLKVLLGSQKEGNRLFQNMAGYAAKVPFEYEKIMESATALAGVMKGGTDEVTEWMPIIGDLAAATGLSIQDTTSQIIRMYSAGAAAADMFRERGVLAMLGFKSGVQYTAEETRKQLVAAWKDPESRFRGATKELATTWKGLMSMLSDQWFKFRNMVMNAGIFDVLKKRAENVRKTIEEFFESGKAQEWARKISSAVEWILEKFDQLIGIGRTIINVLRWFRDNSDLVAAAISLLITAEIIAKWVTWGKVLDATAGAAAKLAKVGLMSSIVDFFKTFMYLPVSGFLFTGPTLMMRLAESVSMLGMALGAGAFAYFFGKWLFNMKIGERTIRQWILGLSDLDKIQRRVAESQQALTEKTERYRKELDKLGVSSFREAMTQHFMVFKEGKWVIASTEERIKAFNDDIKTQTQVLKENEAALDLVAAKYISAKTALEAMEKAYPSMKEGDMYKSIVLYGEDAYHRFTALSKQVNILKKQMDFLAESSRASRRAIKAARSEVEGMTPEEKGGAGGDIDEKKQLAAEEWLRNKRIDLMYNEFDKRRIALADDFAKHKEYFKDLDKAYEVLQKGMTEIAVDEQQKRVEELSRGLKLYADHQSAMTERYGSELDKRLAKVQKFVEDEKAKLQEALAAGADFDYYEAKKELVRRAAEEEYRIRLEYSNQLREQEINNILAVMDMRKQAREIDSVAYYQERIRLLKELEKRYMEMLAIYAAMGPAGREGYLTQLEALQNIRQQLLDNEEALKGYTGSVKEAIHDALFDLKEEYKQFYTHIKDLTTTTFTAMENEMSNIFFDAMMGKLQSAADYWRSFTQTVLQALSQIIAKMIALKIVEAGLKIFGLATGAASGAASAASAAAGSAQAAQSFTGSIVQSAGPGGSMTFHSGGIVAPRYHGGSPVLRSDESLIIAQSGERVMSKEQDKMFRQMYRNLKDRNEQEPRVQVTMPVYAMDAQSFSGFAYQNKEILANVFMAALGSNHAARRTRL